MDEDLAEAAKEVEVSIQTAINNTHNSAFGTKGVFV
jgi:hypothetical protein